MVKTISTPEINKINFKQYYRVDPESEEMKALRRVYHRYYAMKGSQDRRLMERKWDLATKQWEALREERSPDDWQSNHYVPLTHAVIEAAISEIVDESPEPMILPRGQEDIPQAEIMSHLVQWTRDISDFDLKREELLRDAFIMGTAIGQEYYFKDSRRIKTGPNGDSKIEFIEEVQADYNDVYLEPVRLKDFYVDEFARDLHKGPYRARDCVRRYVMNIDDFRLFFSGDMDPLGNAKYVLPGGSVQFDSYFEFFKPPEGIDISNQVEVLWYWSVKPDDWLIIVSNSVLIYMGPNPYKHKQLPFVRLVDVKRPHRFYGKGEADILESIQDEMNIIRRQIIDRNHLDIDKMFIGSSRLMLADEDLIARPHGFIPTEDKDAIKPVEYGDIPRSVELSLAHLDDDAVMGTGINPKQEAMPAAITATAAAIAKETTLKRIRLKISRLNLEFMTDMMRLRVSNILQFYPEEKMEKIVGEADTQQYEDEMSKLEAKGWVRNFNPNTNTLIEPNKSRKYKQIRLNSKALDFDEKGNARIISSPQPYSFFELKPEYFMPNQGGFDIKFAAGSDIPISKPLMQSKMSDMYDRLIQLSVANVGGAQGYDPVKLGDQLLKVNDLNPQDFHLDQPGQDQGGQQLEMSINLAGMENQMMMRGKDVPATPYAPVAHTQIHIQFTGSPAFQNMTKDDKRIDIFLNHIMGELLAQSQRAGAGGMPSSQPQLPPGFQPLGNAPQVIPGATSPGGTPAVQTPQTPQSNTMGNIQPNQMTGGQMQQNLHPGI